MRLTALLPLLAALTTLAFAAPAAEPGALVESSSPREMTARQADVLEDVRYVPFRSPQSTLLFPIEYR